MPTYIDGKAVTIYNGDYKPIKMMVNRKMVAGWRTLHLDGEALYAEDTYNDLLDCKVYGKHSQESHKAVWWNQVAPDIEGLHDFVKFTELCGYTSDINGEFTLTNNNAIDPYIYLVTKINHKILVTGDMMTNSNSPQRGIWIDFTDKGNIRIFNDNPNEWKHFEFVYSYNGNSEDSPREGALRFYAPFHYENEGKTTTYKKVKVVDLTAMFGEGREPTAEEFRKMFPCDYYPYCAGEWRYAPKGQWVKFNQLIDNGNFENGLNGFNPYMGVKNDNITISIENNKLRVDVIKDNVGGDPSAVTTIVKKRIIIDHVYYVGYEIDIHCQNTIRPAIEGPIGGLSLKKIGNTNIYGNIVKSIRNATNIYIRPVGSKIVGDYWLVDNFVLHDLTEMFGEGNEPTSVEEFKTLYPKEYYEYTEGRYEDTGGFVVNGEKVPQPLDSGFSTPMPDLPEEIKVLENPKINVDSEGVMWNQLIRNVDYLYPNFENGRQDGYDCYTRGEQIVLEKLSNHRTWNACVFTNSCKMIEGHSYMFMLRVRCDMTYNNITSIKVGRKEYTFPTFVNSSWRLNWFNFTCETNTNSITIRPVGFMYADGMSATLYAKDIMLFDLTAMFENGIRPYTADEFAKMLGYPSIDSLPYFAFDKGTRRTIKALHEIKSTEDVLPFTLYGANGVFDTCKPCVLVDGEWKCRVTRRWGHVDLGSADIAYDSHRRFVVINIGAKTDSNDVTKGIYCEIYKPDSSPISVTEKDFTISKYKTGNIYLYDSCFRSIEQFKEGRNGVILHYELETPQVELYDPIPIRTLPINTIVTSEARMEAEIKVVDK